MVPTEIRNARVLIVVKAYPNPSRSHVETVCTAGLLDGERWVRIYPVSFRFLSDESKYKKFSWIKLNLASRADKDFRPESHRPLMGEQEDIQVLQEIKPTRDGWSERKRLVLKNVYDSMDALIDDAYSPRHVSIGVMKPSQILDVVSEPASRDWDIGAIERSKEMDLFDSDDGVRKLVKKVPYKFSYRFKTKDGKERTLMIEDWELGALYWNCLRNSSGNELEAVEKVKNKYWNIAKNYDVYFILGTTFVWHSKKSLNPFVIIGVFSPPVDNQLEFELNE